MRKTLLILLFFTPIAAFSQLSNDGKSDAIVKLNSGNSSHPFSVLIAGNTLAPLGVKFQYCKSFGGYAAFKSDFGAINHYITADATKSDENHYFITTGVSKSLGKSTNLYLGGGLDLGSEGYEHIGGIDFRDSGFALETGTIFKIKKFTLDVGLGLMIEKWIDDNFIEYDEYTVRRIAVNFGLGYSF